MTEKERLWGKDMEAAGNPSQAGKGVNAEAPMIRCRIVN
jgi:hypothetical protein